MSSTRVRVPDKVQETVLLQSKRRCCLCYGLHDNLSVKDGQLAHIDRDPSNSEEANLCWLCLEHHKDYDARFAQAKRLTPAELRHYKALLYRALSTSTVRFQIKVEGEIDRAIAGDVLDEILEDIERRVEGMPVTVNRVTSGSIVLHLEGPPPAFSRLRDAFTNGQLVELAGHAVISVDEEDPQPDVEDLLTLTNDLFIEDRHEDALACCRKALQKAPDSAVGLLALSTILLKMHRILENVTESKFLDEAYTSILRANELDVTDGRVWSNKGAILLEFERIQEGLRCHRTAVDLAPGDGQIWHNYGVGLFNLGRFSESIAPLERACELGAEEEAADVLNMARVNAKRRPK